MADKGLTYAEAGESVLQLGTVEAIRGDAPRVAFSGHLDLAG
jgi:hypothetical protein